MDNSSTVVGNRSHKLPGQGLCILSPTLDEMVERCDRRRGRRRCRRFGVSAQNLPRIPQTQRHKRTNAPRKCPAPQGSYWCTSPGIWLIRPNGSSGPSGHRVFCQGLSPRTKVALNFVRDDHDWRTRTTRRVWDVLTTRVTVLPAGEVGQRTNPKRWRAGKLARTAPHEQKTMDHFKQRKIAHCENRTDGMKNNSKQKSNEYCVGSA